MQQEMKPLKIGNFVATLPIIQGGMGIGVSLSKLASAVANEGGIGVISAACIERLPFARKKGISNTHAIKEQIKEARTLTKGILGVNIMVALSDFTALAKACIEEKIDIIFAGAGLPLNLPEFLNKNSTTKLVPIVSSGKAASLISKWWKQKYNYSPDAFVVEGPKAGGHLGFSKEQITDPDFELENLVLDVLKHTNNLTTNSGDKIPVIAAGGIYSGSDIYRFLKLGASGVQMGTRFVATNECDASNEYKNAYINCKKEDIKIVISPVGMPGRAILNSFIKNVNQGLSSPKQCHYGCITPCEKEKSPYCIATALLSAVSGKTDNGLVFIGANGYKVDKILSVQNLIKELKQEYFSAQCTEQAERKNAE